MELQANVCHQLCTAEKQQIRVPMPPGQGQAACEGRKVRDPEIRTLAQRGVSQPLCPPPSARTARARPSRVLTGLEALRQPTRPRLLPPTLLWPLPLLSVQLMSHSCPAPPRRGESVKTRQTFRPGGNVPSCIDPCSRSVFISPVHKAPANSTCQDLTGHLTHQHRAWQDAPRGRRQDNGTMTRRPARPVFLPVTQNLPGG